MGTISDKLEYLNDTKGLLKQKINNLGGSIDDNTTFRQYANQLQNVYDNLPKTEYQEGTDITLSNTLKGKLDYENGVVGIGQSSQDSYQGYNILENKMAYSVTSGGVTYTKRADGSVLVNGTANSTSFCALTKESNTLILPTEKIFTIDSAFYYTPQDASILLMFRGMDGNYGNCSSMANKDIGVIYLQVLNGATINNQVVYPMIINGSSAVKPYEPYVGGQASPNPSYPQEIKCVRGKNLLDSELEKGTYNDNTGEQIATDGNYRNVSPIKVFPNTAYTFSINGVKQKYCVYYYDSSNNFISWIPAETGTFITPNNCYYINFRCYVADYTSDFANLKIQLEKGSQATSYLPYNTIGVKARGKNVFDEKTKLPASRVINGITYTNNGDGTFNVSGTATSGFFVLNISVGSLLEKGKKYGLYSSKEYSNPGFNYTLTFTGNSTRYVIANANPGEYDEQKTEAKLSLWVDNGATLNATNVKTMIYESDTIDTNYEPYYTPQIKQLSLGNFNPSKIGNYKDYFYRTNGKNKFDNSVERKNAYIGASGSDIGTTITYYNSSATYTYVNCAYVEAGKTYTLSWKQSTTPASINTRVGAIVDNNNIVLNTQNTWQNSSTSITFTPNVSGYLVLCTDINAINIQLELGNTATDYNPYGSGEWYFKEKVGKKNIADSSAWEDYSAYWGACSFGITKTIFEKQPIAWSDMYSKYFKAYTTSQTKNLSNEIVIGSTTLIVNNKETTTLSAFRNWLASNPFYIYYQLAISTDTKITDTTMITQLENIYNLMSYNGATILEVDGDLSMIIKARALKGE